MHGIVLTFEPDRDQQVRDIQQQLQADFGLIHIPTHPHCSLHVAQTYDFALTKSILLEWAQSVPPIKLTASGYGLFPQADSVVVYSTIAQTPHLTAVHIDLYNRMQAATEQFHTLYTPEQWVPHATYGSLPKTDFGNAMRWLIEQPAYWSTTSTEIAIMEYRQGTYVKRFATPLCGQTDTL